jgi:DNA polymerase elongation subunit (family B)
MSIENKVYHYSDIRHLPNRNDFIINRDKPLNDRINRQIKNKEKLLFLPTYLVETHFQDYKYSSTKYKIILIGILEDGRKVNVMLDNIYPYFEIKLNKTETSEEYNDKVNKISEKMVECGAIDDVENIMKIPKPFEEESNYNKFPSTIKAKSFKYFQEEKSNFYRYYFEKLNVKDKPNRRMAIKLAKELGLDTATDDMRDYYRVVCRDFQTTFSSWVSLENYYYVEPKKCEICYNKALKKYGAEVAERVPYANYGTSHSYQNFYREPNDINYNLKRCEAHAEEKDFCFRLKGETFILSVENYKPVIPIPKELLKDKTLSMTWDIETWSPDGSLPEPINPEHRIFSIGITFQFVNEDKPIAKYCLCDFPADALVKDSEFSYTTIVCENEKNMIESFAKIVNKMMPEFIFGFNDSSYDWNWLIERGRTYENILERLANNDVMIPFFEMDDENIYKKHFKTEKVKVEADNNVDGKMFCVNGIIPVDVRTVFRKLYPTAEQSNLKWFLEKNKLGGKEDMPYERLFKIYTRYNNLVKSLHTNSLQESLNINDSQESLTLNSLHANDSQESSQSNEISINNLSNILKYDLNNVPEEKQEEYLLLKKELAEINYYCLIDAFRCHELMKIRSVIMDHREVANTAYCSLYDAFYRANGMKVRNLTIAIGQRKPFYIRFTNISEKIEDEGKYPGAFVFPPKKGIQTSKLSLIELIEKAKKAKAEDIKYHDSFNYEWADTTEEKLQEYYNIIDEKGIQADIEHEDKKFVEFMKTPTGRPVTGLDFSSLYPSLIRCYNLSPEYCVLEPERAQLLQEKYKLVEVDFMYGGERKIGWFVWHNNKIKIDEEGFMFGVYPYILNDLFNRRALLKKEMKKYDHRKEEIEAMSDEEQKIYQNEYSDVLFNKNYLNSKQNALKVFMNTFYGEAGNKISPFFVLHVAGGITQYGKRNIQFAYQFVRNKQCNVYYGDTDSLYLSVPESTFTEIDKLYYTNRISKLEYWTQQVELTFKVINDIQNGVNKAFIEDNKTSFLSMAYEEVLFPVVFTAKKKYFGIAHENIANFKPKDLFIRGIEVKKRGVSELLKKIFTEIMWDCCNINNLFTIMELVIQKIHYIYSKTWDLKYFVQTGVYKPNKKNVKIQTLVERMKEKDIKIEPNERFNFVIVKKYPYKYDIRGRKEELSIGERIDLLDVAIKENLQVDLDFYMEGSINGQLARLITYHEMFEGEDDKTYKDAVKYISEYASQFYTQYNSYDKEHKKIYSKVSEKVKNESLLYDPFMTKLFSKEICKREKKSDIREDIELYRDELFVRIESQIDKDMPEIVNSYYEWRLKLIKEKLISKSDILKELNNKYAESDENIKKELHKKIKTHKLSIDKEAKDILLKELSHLYKENKPNTPKIYEKIKQEHELLYMSLKREKIEEFFKLHELYNSPIDNIVLNIKSLLNLKSYEKPVSELTEEDKKNIKEIIDKVTIDEGYKQDISLLYQKREILTKYANYYKKIHDEYYKYKKIEYIYDKIQVLTGGDSIQKPIDHGGRLQDDITAELGLKTEIGNTTKEDEYASLVDDE